MKYLLDSNVFIEAYKRYYSVKIVPSFWKFITEDDELFTLEEVLDEVKKGNDGLINLIKNMNIYHENIDDNNASKIAKYINDNYSDEEANKFFSGADFPLVSVAFGKNFLTIVTHEKKLEPNAKKVSIPNVCEKFKISYINTFKMLQDKNINLSEY